MFYILYPPDYICLDNNMLNPKSCSQEQACSPGQNFIFESSKSN